MKKLLLFLMVAIPILVVLIVKLTASVTVGDVFISVESIKLYETSISARVGQSVDLSFNIRPELASNKDVIWSSDNESVAVVDMNGHVEFVGIGSGYITVTTKDGNKKSQCSFYVWDEKVYGVKLTAPKNYLHIGESMQLVATIIPNEAINREIKYTSNNEERATVDSNGVVYGKKEGSVIITATSEDGGYTDSVELSIRNPVTALVVEQTEVITASKQIQIEYIVEPYNATIKTVNFTVDDSEMAEVNHLGLVTFKKIGWVTVTLTTDDGNFQKQIRYFYTGGYAYDLVLDTHQINMQVDDAPVFIEYQTLPENLYMTKVEFSSYDEDVAYVDASGYLHAVKGGNTVVTVKVHKTATDVIEKQIYVNVESPTKEIFIDDVVTADSSYQLNPKSAPEDCTNLSYFYHVDDESLASVSEEGLVTFNSQTPCTVTVTIYANSDYSDVSKSVKLTYTAGKASSVELLDKEILLMYGQTTSLRFLSKPDNVTILPVSMTIEECQPKVAGGTVVEILGNGQIHAVGGGKATVKVQVVLYDDTVVEEYCNITVLRDPYDIEINLDLDFYEGRYVTSENVVRFSGKVLPDDATNTNIIWSVGDDIAFIRDGAIIFNHVGYTTLTATVGEVSKSVEVYYTGLNPVYAQVQAVIDGKTTPIPEKIMVGESFEVEISQIIPQYTINPPLSIQATNEQTAITGHVLEIENNKVIGVSGGTATLVIYISQSIRLNFSITVERKPEKLSVLQADSTVTTNVVELVSEVLPYDTTNQDVRYVVHQTDIAYVEGSTLTFKKNGIVNITAICEADENIVFDFFIEKVDKDIIHVSPEEKNVTINKGEMLVFDIPSAYELNIEQNFPTVSGEMVVVVEGRYLRALSAGRATVSVAVGDQQYRVEIQVEQLVEDIIFNTQADFYGDGYVVGKDTIDLNFEIYPSFAKNKEVSVSILRSVSSEGKPEQIAFITDGKLFFTRAGNVTLQVSSKDGGCTKIFKLTYTGGDALDAQLNVGNKLVINVGEKVTIGVSKWLPYDVTNTKISLQEVNSSGKKVIELNAKTRTIVGLESGQTKLIVELSNGIVKEVEVLCVKKVSEIEVEDNILTSQSTYEIEASVSPDDATNKTLEYILQETDVARISENILYFTKPGKVVVIVRTTDGSNLEKEVHITSTFGYYGEIKFLKQQLKLNKGEEALLQVEGYPTDALHNRLEYRLISQNPCDGKSPVVELRQDGIVKALFRGSATIRVVAFDYFGTEIYADCEVFVESPLKSIEVVFYRELDQYQNQSSFITSKKELNFNILYQPEDADIEKFSYDISDEQFARIEGKTITFLQKGRVTITFKCKDKLSMEKEVSYTFYYVGEDLVEATLDKTNVQNNTISLEVGGSFEFALKKALPSDNVNIIFSIQDISEKRNDPDKEVARFENGVLYALNGGTYSFTLYANGLKLEKLTLIVTRKATGIEIDGEEDVYISVPYYKISARALESDTSQRTLGFLANTDIVTVSFDGNVTFKEMGSCEITVYIADNPSIYKIIRITYTKELQEIEFNETRESLYVGEHINLFVTGKPVNAEKFSYTMQVDREDIAQLIKNDEGYRLIGQKSGEVVVTAKVDGKEITAQKKITIFDKITNIKLELDPSGDKSGHGEYRVFGNKFIDANNAVVNTFKMNVAVIPNEISPELLEWTSNNEQVATVDQNGIVTFLSTGKVVITVRQKMPYEGAIVESDRYEFTVVDGINIYNANQFSTAINELNNKLNKGKTENYSALVLQEDIHLNADVKILQLDCNVYGNGNTLDHSNSGPDTWGYFAIRRNNIVLDNVILRALQISDGLQLKDTGNVLLIENCSNVLLYNTIIENAENGVRIQSSQVDFEGCIFRNCLLFGMKVARSEAVVSHVKVKDCIFTSSIGGIMFSMGTYDNKENSVVSLEGEVRFYTWATLEQLEQCVDLHKHIDKYGISFVSSEVYRQLREIVKKDGQKYAITYKGTTYYNLATVALSANIFSKEIASYGVVDKTKLNPSCNYSELPASGAIDVAIVVPVEATILSLTSDKPFIKPGDMYLDDPNVLSKIKKPSRF